MNTLARRVLAVLASVVAAGVLIAGGNLVAWAGGLGMQIHVILPSTADLTLDVEGSDSIENVKQKVQDRTQDDPDTFYLTFDGAVLATGRILDEYNIQAGDTLQLFFNAGAPVWSGGKPALNCGQSMSRSIASSGTGVQYGVVRGHLPAGLTLNGLSGVISGTPTTGGQYSFTVSANNEGSSARTTFTGSVSCGLANTGRDSQGLLALGGATLVLGALLLLARARRQRL